MNRAEEDAERSATEVILGTAEEARENLVQCAGCAGDIDENDLMDPADLIAGLMPGDIFHARAKSGGSWICLVTAVDNASISARRVTTQEDVVFDRRTGIDLRKESTVRIDAVEPLPIDIHNVFLGLDRRYRLGRRFNRAKLRREEVAAILSIDEFYRGYLLWSEHADGGQGA